MTFWDASAIVPLLFAEAEHDAMLRRLESDPAMLVWWGTPVECVSAIARREREQSLTLAAATDAIDRLKSLANAWDEVVASAAVRTTAQRLLRVHPLRAADALQLAAALVAANAEPASLPFVCLDERLAEAAQREGFPVQAVPLT